MLPLWGTNGASDAPTTLPARMPSLCPGNHSSQSSALRFLNLLSSGSPSKHFPFCSQTRHAAAPCMHRQKCLSQAVSKWLCWSGDKEFHFTGKRPASKSSFFRKFRAAIGLKHRSPYSATCFLHSILLSSALQM